MVYGYGQKCSRLFIDKWKSKYYIYVHLIVWLRMFKCIIINFFFQLFIYGSILSILHSIIRGCDIAILSLVTPRHWVIHRHIYNACHSFDTTYMLNIILDVQVLIILIIYILHNTTFFQQFIHSIFELFNLTTIILILNKILTLSRTILCACCPLPSTPFQLLYIHSIIGLNGAG